MTNDFVSFLNKFKEGQSCKSLGIEFHSLIPSLLHVFNVNVFTFCLQSFCHYLLILDDLAFHFQLPLVIRFWFQNFICNFSQFSFIFCFENSVIIKVNAFFSDKSLYFSELYIDLFMKICNLLVDMGDVI